MPGRVADKGMVITGAGSGMGRAFALGLAREGAIIGVLDVNQDAAGLVADEISASSAAPAVALCADVSRRAEVTRALDVFIEHFGRLDVLFNNAGINAERPGQAVADFSAGILRGRAATPEDIVGTALFLASTDSDYITGQVVMADGGMVLV
jgi:NAD(P)-dependent dehydrogenase (short-subunit alcohol dehydrogenase family)